MKNDALALFELNIIDQGEYESLTHMDIHQSHDFFRHINLNDENKLKNIAVFFSKKHEIQFESIINIPASKIQIRNLCRVDRLVFEDHSSSTVLISHPIEKKILNNAHMNIEKFKYHIISHHELMMTFNQIEHQRIKKIEKEKLPISIQDIFNFTLNHGILKQASDIHIEKLEQAMRIRLRGDGTLNTLFLSTTLNYESLISYIKVRSNCDITQHRLPQDGRDSYTNTWGHHKNLRISICPGMHGEKIVIRILKKEVEINDFNQLGLNEKTIQHIERKIQSHGLILICGPTGSGKTTTLYTILKKLRNKDYNIMSAEDPIELPISGIHQLSINEKIGLSFSTALRCFLRQDPDVIMVGEMRDQDTANIAIKSSQTGHLVLSTLHCNSAQDSFIRLKDLSITDLQLKSVTLVINQRLLKTLCAYCKIEINSQFKDTKTKKNSLYMRNSQGCDHCSNGLSGRIGIFEVWDSINDLFICEFEESIQHLIELGLIDYSTPTTINSHTFI